MHLLPKQILNRLTIKNVKTGIGHDLAGMYCDFYLDGKKIGYYNNDGHGGMPDIRISDKAYVDMLEALFTETNMRQFIADDYNNSNNSGLTKIWEVRDFDFDNVIEFIAERMEFVKGVLKQEKKGIVYGKPNSGTYSSITWKGLTVEDVIKRMGDEAFQKKIDEIKGRLEAGHFIFNTNLEKFLK
jgi:hypothetical protein